MKKFFAFLFLVSSISLSVKARSNWSCQSYYGGTYNLYCGGAFIANYPNALECVQGRKEICDSTNNNSNMNYECEPSVGNLYNLYCGGAFIGRYNSGYDCVQARKELCD